MFSRLCPALFALFLPFDVAFAHHTYAMFDAREPLVVRGSLAKLEWRNPHSFVWLYVRKPDKPAEYDLWSFESDPITLMQRNGWTKGAVRPGDKVTVQYFPLRDGRNGGYLIRLALPDGVELPGDRHAPGVAAALDKGPLLEPRASR
jgi:hypothetical protein